MTIFFNYIISLIFTFTAISAYSQDTILLLSGDKIITSKCEFIDSTESFTYVNKKNKLKELSFDGVFSVTKFASKEKVFYKADSIDENGSFLYSESEMRDYMKGRVLASKDIEAAGATITSAYMGFGITFLKFNPMLPIAPVAGVAILGLFKVTERNILKKHPEFSGNVALIDGYKDSAESKRSKRVIKGMVIGLVTGLVFNGFSSCL